MSHQTISTSRETFNRSAHLDAHFEANRGGYTAQLHKVGIQPGWHVLDVGAGGGNYLPLTAELVGPSGQITALDLSAENVESMRERLGAWDMACPVDVLEGSILDLPFDRDTFDAVWCANTSQQLSDDDLGRALGEFRRVTKPGGLVAIKDINMAHSRIQPSNPAYIWRAHDRGKSWEHFHGAWRSWNLQRFLERAGLEDVQSEASLIEHRAPLSDIDRQALANFWRDVFAVYHAELAEQTAIDGDELQFWIDLRDDTPDSVLNHPDFYATEGQILAVGRTPKNGEPQQ